jgi:hypothetical protein
MSLSDAIAKGIAAHGMWKQRLISAIKTGQSEWTPAVVCQDNQCEFGKWLYSCTAQDKSSPHFSKVKDLHAQFHKEAAEVLKMALEKRSQEASKAIETGSKYHGISSKLTMEMMSWKRVVE